MKSLSLKLLVMSTGLASVLLTGCGTSFNSSTPIANQETPAITSYPLEAAKPELPFDLLPKELQLPYNSGMVSVSKEAAEVLKKYRPGLPSQTLKDKIGPLWQDSFNCYNATSYGDGGTITVRYKGGGYFNYSVNMYNPSKYYSITSHLYINGRFIAWGGQSNDFYAITGDEVVVGADAQGATSYAYGSISCAASKTSNF